MSFKKKREIRDEIQELLPALKAFSRRLIRRREDADDLLHDTVALALKGERGFDGANLRSWMFTIMKNRAINLHRKGAHRTRHEESVSASSCGVWFGSRPLPPDSFLEGSDVRAAVSALPPERADAVIAFGVDGLSYQEMADELGRPIGTIMSRLHRARRALQESLR